MCVPVGAGAGLVSAAVRRGADLPRGTAAPPLSQAQGVKEEEIEEQTKIGHIFA